MKNKPLVNHAFCLFTFAFLLYSGVSAQNLTLRDIMAEPSIAGMRVEGEKLSPDGTKVVYLWNPEGKLPRSLYMVPTSGGAPVKILSPGDLPAPTRPPQPESKLNYGVELRDEFVKVRENQLGNVEWSPDSGKLIFTYGGDIYVLAFSGVSDEFLRYRRSTIDSVMQRRIQLTNEFIQAVKRAGVQEEELFQDVTASGEALSRIVSGKGLDAIGVKEVSDTTFFSAIDAFQKKISRLESLPESYPQLRSDKRVMNAITELTGNQNRLNVALLDYKVTSTNKALKRFTKTQSPEFGARFLDNDRIMFSQGGNVFVMNTSDSTLTQLTKEANQQNFISVGNVTPNKAGTLLAYVVTDSSKQRALVVPNYLPEFVGGGGPRRGWSEQKLFVTPADGSRDTPFEIKLPKPEGVSNFRRMAWTADGDSLIVDRVDRDTKRRQLFYVNNVGSKGERIILITEETDDKWQASLSVIFEPNPKKPGELIFGSERDGYNHLYLANLEAETRPVGSVPDDNARVAEGGESLSKDVKITQLTKGSWQVEWAKWTPNAEELVFLSTMDGYTERQFYSIYLADRNVAKVEGMPEKGMRGSPQINDYFQPYLLYEFSKWNKPGELHTVRVCPRCRGMSFAVKLTQSAPAGFADRKWTEPKFIEIASKDGKKIPAKIYLPPGHNVKSKTKYPMVVFVHGAGYLQNVINGWNNYYREFMFNQMLTQKGYVVLDIDYRGSAGYGRDWRTDVYDFLGGKDFDDHIDAVDFMVKNYAVDQKRIGTYGGSYGGFMAAMLATRAPDRIAAAAALRPVMDWKNYYAANPGYTAQRLGFPDKNPEGYKRSSPITYADKLERPLLILHGMSDDNVHVQDSVQMIEKLIRLGKTQYFEAMLYPSENHAFVRPESWTDEYERILAFFEKHLNRNSPQSSQRTQR